jgi:lipid-A-disaccharide synthase
MPNPVTKMRDEIIMVAGEASGDLHGSNVIRELRSMKPGIHIYGVGGDQMKGEGMQLMYHINELSFMGFSDVLRNLSVIRSLERTLKSLIQLKKPRLIVLIDFPGLNLRLARHAHAAGVPVLYYIAPQVWAWGKGRIKKIRDTVDHLFVIIPFEEKLFRDAGVKTEFVGHPILDLMEVTSERESFYGSHNLDYERKILALFPGSRSKEIVNHIGVMAQAALELEARYNMQPVIGVSQNLSTEYVRSQLPDGAKEIPLIQGATYNLMRHAAFAFVKSGTTTLEATCFQTPMVVLYKTSKINYLIGKMIVNLKHFSLVNILADAEIVRELSQNQVTVRNLVAEAENMLMDPQKYTDMRQKLGEIKAMLGERGASRRVAEHITAYLNVA